LPNQTTPPDQVDVRGPRFAAWVTTAVLVVALLVSAYSAAAAAIVLGVQAVVFAVGALGGPRKHPYGRVFSAVVAPRLGPVTEREPVPPLKFAQLVGVVFAVLGTVGFATTALALVAAFLNAAFGICLGCRLYPLVTRLRSTATPA
jgi:hypothetical protein